MVVDRTHNLSIERAGKCLTCGMCASRFGVGALARGKASTSRFINAYYSWYISGFFKGVLGTRFGSLKSAKIIIGSLEPEQPGPTGPYRVPNISLKKRGIYIYIYTVYIPCTVTLSVFRLLAFQSTLSLLWIHGAYFLSTSNALFPGLNIPSWYLAMETPTRFRISLYHWRHKFWRFWQKGIVNLRDAALTDAFRYCKNKGRITYKTFQYRGNSTPLRSASLFHEHRPGTKKEEYQMKIPYKVKLDTEIWRLWKKSFVLKTPTTRFAHGACRETQVEPIRRTYRCRCRRAAG